MLAQFIALKLTVVSPVQFEKAMNPILVMDSGIVTLSNPVQP